MRKECSIKEIRKECVLVEGGGMLDNTSTYIWGVRSDWQKAKEKRKRDIVATQIV
jgi:hypothetical protein